MGEEMKRILIFTHAMEIGGAERALLGLLESLDYTKCSVDLFLMRHSGDLMQYIPNEVNILNEIPQYASLAVPIGNVLKKKHFSVAIGRTMGKIAAYLKKRRLNYTEDSDIQLEYSHKYTGWAMPLISKEEYDLAVSFLTPHYFVRDKVKARKKVAWIHTDYSQIKIDVKSELAMWEKYDKIVSISKDVTRSFLHIFPTLKDKVVEIQNIMPIKSINKQVNEAEYEKEMFDDGSIKLLSIGRFCKAKNFDNVPIICKLIRDAGLNVKWYLIGFGGDEELIRQKIHDISMEEFVIILGKKDNPYPYIKNCDIYIQPSRFEGNAVTVHEAQLLKKPVVITNYETAKSQLKDGIDGIIVPMNNEKCAQGIVELLKDHTKMQRLSKVCEGNDYSNKMEIEKFMELMD